MKPHNWAFVTRWRRPASSVPRPNLTIRTYIVGAVALIFVVTGVSIAYTHWRSVEQARTSAAQDSKFAAHLAALGLSSSLKSAKSQIATLRTTPGVSLVYTTSLPACRLSFQGARLVTQGHVDLIGPTGRDACSSLRSRPASYAGSAWLAEARTRSVVVGPVPDPATGQQVIVVAAPTPGSGVAAEFIDLNAPTSSGLPSAGPRHLEFLVLAKTEYNHSLALDRVLRSG